MIPRPGFIYSVGLILTLIIFIKPNLISCFQTCIIWLSLGVNLIVYDSFGSVISRYVESPYGVCNQTFLFSLCDKKQRRFKRHFSTKTFGVIFIGTTRMTATGRATLIVGVFAGASLFINNHLDRAAANQQAAYDRAFQAY